jgi:hypothetical protein
MYTISEYGACVVLMLTLGTLLFGFCVVLLAIKWGIESLWGTSRAIQQDGTHFFSRPAVRDARHRAVAGAEPPVCLVLAKGESMSRRTHGEMRSYNQGKGAIEFTRELRLL